MEHCIVVEEMSRAAGGVALSYGAHSNLSVNQINRHGTAEQKERFLPKVRAGRRGWEGRGTRLRMGGVFPTVRGARGFTV